MKVLIRDKEEKGEIRFYAVKIIKLNPETFIYEVRKYFMSELFTALLGATTQQVADFIMRKGLFEAYDRSSDVTCMIKNFLQVKQERIS